LPPARQTRHATPREGRSTHPHAHDRRDSRSQCGCAGVTPSTLNLSRTVPRDSAARIRCHNRRDSCTLRGASEVALRGSNLRRTFPRESPTSIRNHDWCSPKLMWLLRSDLRGAGPARGLPRETRIESNHDEWDIQRSALLFCWSCPQGGESVPQSPKGLRKRSHASSADCFHGREALRRLGEPLPQQLTCRAQTSPSHPNTPIELLRYRRCRLYPLLPVARPDRGASFYVWPAPSTDRLHAWNLFDC